MAKVYHPARLCFEGGECLRKHLVGNSFEMVFPVGDEEALDRAEMVMDALKGVYTHTPQKKENGDYHLIFTRREEARAA